VFVGAGGQHGGGSDFGAKAGHFSYFVPVLSD